jgi:hypothetical protein
MINAFLPILRLHYKAFPSFIGRFLIVVWVSLFYTGPVFGIASTNVPLDDYAYKDLEKLIVQGLIKSDLWGTRPMSRLEMARLVYDARENWEMIPPQEKKTLTVIEEILIRFEKRFREELEAVSGHQTIVKTFIKPLERITFHYRYQDGDYSGPNNEGLDFYESNNALIDATMRAKIAGYFGLFVQPRFLYYENKDDLRSIKGDEVEEADTVFQKAYINLTVKNFEIQYGKDSLWWGPGYHGALIMSNNAEPFGIFKLSNPAPTILPWFFRYLGLFKYNLIFGTLDSNRLNPRPGRESFITDHDNPYFSGLHLDMKPFPWFEWGINHINIYGGEGRKGLDFQDHLEILFRNKNLSGKQSANSETSAFIMLRWYDFSDFLPLAETLSFYGEWGGEDKAYPPDDRAYQMGLLFGDFLKWQSRLQLRLEYTNTTPFRDEPKDVWYAHPEYPATYEGRVLGHHVGSNAEDYFARLDISMTPRLDLGLQADYEWRGTALEAEEKVVQWQLDTHYRWTENTSLFGVVGIEEVENHDFVKGASERNSFFSLMMRYYF